MKIDRINYQELDEPVGPYVHAVKHNGVLYLSGITAFGTPAGVPPYLPEWRQPSLWVLEDVSPERGVT